MLEMIHIRNFALIDDLTLEFSKGLNILTGETGAGKSIIIGALNCILGERVSSENIRSGAERCLIEAQVSVEPLTDLPALLEKSGLEAEDGQIIIRREFSKDGKNRIRINNSPVNLSFLKELGNQIVDIHGQHEHQSLFRVEQHIKILDGFGGLEKKRFDFLNAFTEYQNLLHTKEKLLLNEKDKERMTEMLRFAVQEISEADLKEGEDQTLEEEIRKLSHREKLLENIDYIYTILYNKDESIISLLDSGQQSLEKITDLDRDLEPVREAWETIRYQSEDMASVLRNYRDGSLFDLSSLDHLIERSELIKNLKKKYGGTVSSILEYMVQAEKDLDSIIHREEELKDIDERILKKSLDLSLQALDLSGRRHVIAKVLEDKVNTELRELDMKGALFTIDFRVEEEDHGIVSIGGKPCKCYKHGVDQVEFMIRTNVGEDSHPLRKIISGGELSRTMLALKTIFAQADRIGTMVFDEIDSGVSGQTAFTVGEKMENLAEEKQILCITHLPQIAARSQRHFMVSKETLNEKTFTRVRVLDTEQKIKEIARIMDGDQASPVTIQHARELIDKKRSMN